MIFIPGGGGRSVGGVVFNSSNKSSTDSEPVISKTNTKNKTRDIKIQRPQKIVKVSHFKFSCPVLVPMTN